MSGTFGKDISRAWYPEDDGEPVNLPSQTPTIYIFDEKPTREAAAAGTDALQTVSSWTAQSSIPYKRSWTITAVDDPEPTSNTPERRYYEAINFIGKTGGTSHTVIRSFIVRRQEGAESIPDTTPSDLKEVFPAISNYLNDSQIDDLIKIAELEVRMEFESRGYRWADIYNLDKIRIPIAYRAIEMGSMSQIRRTNDNHETRAKLFRSRYSQFMKLVELPSDSNRDGEPEHQIQAQPTSFIIGK